MSAPLKTLLESECNRYANGFCNTRACLVRGGYKEGGPVDTEIATCEAHEMLIQIAELARLNEVSGCSADRRQAMKPKTDAQTVTITFRWFTDWFKESHLLVAPHQSCEWTLMMRMQRGGQEVFTTTTLKDLAASRLKLLEWIDRNDKEASLIEEAAIRAKEAETLTRLIGEFDCERISGGSAEQKRELLEYARKHSTQPYQPEAVHPLTHMDCAGARWLRRGQDQPWAKVTAVEPDGITAAFGAHEVLMPWQVLCDELWQWTDDAGGRRWAPCRKQRGHDGHHPHLMTVQYHWSENSD